MKKTNPLKKHTTSPTNILARERATKALALRVKGLTYSAIAAEVGYNGRTTAAEAVKRLLQTMPVEVFEEASKLAVKRLDVYLRARHDQASEGDDQAIQTCLKIVDRHIELLKLTAPPREQKVTIKADPSASIDAATLAAMSDEELKALMGHVEAIGLGFVNKKEAPVA